MSQFTQAFVSAAIQERAEFRAKLSAIEALCRRYNTPAVNTGAHYLAGAVLKIVEEPNA